MCDGAVWSVVCVSVVCEYVSVVCEYVSVVCVYVCAGDAGAT